MYNKMWEILNPKHQILNKFKFLNQKFKTNLSKGSFTKERFRCFCHWNFGNLGLFRISNFEFGIYIVHAVASNYGGKEV